MYSPKIREDYIPIIYRLAKRKRMHMTTLVNEIIDTELRKAKKSVYRTGNRLVPRTRS